MAMNGWSKHTYAHGEVDYIYFRDNKRIGSIAKLRIGEWFAAGAEANYNETRRFSTKKAAMKWIEKF